MAHLVETEFSVADVSKQATKALKCVAFTSRQVGEMLERKHERILKRIRSISEEIESLKTDVMENITHQRERRAQLTEIEEDVERAQLLGNAALVEDLLEELRVLKDEAKREDSLYRALCKTVRSRKESKRQFMHERLAVEEEIRNFTCKQKLIETLLATCSKQSFSSDNTQGSSASQSDCGASALESRAEDSLEVDGEDVEPDNASASSSTPSFPENPFDSPVMRPAEPFYHERLMYKSVSLDTTPVKRQLRVRSFSTDCAPVTHRESIQTRPRHSLSVHFASPVLMYETRGEELAQDLESLDLSSMGSIDEMATPADVEEETKAVEEVGTSLVTESTPEESKPQEAEHEVVITEPETIIETPAKTLDSEFMVQPLMDGELVPASATGTAAA